MVSSCRGSDGDNYGAPSFIHPSGHHGIAAPLGPSLAKTGPLEPIQNAARLLQILG
jgi:hypothetical protein